MTATATATATIGTNTEVPPRIRTLRERLENAMGEALDKALSEPRTDGIDLSTSIASILLTYHLPVVRDVIDSTTVFQTLIKKLRAADQAYNRAREISGEEYDREAMLHFMAEYMVPVVWPE
jgi:hypothetical protein